MTPEQIIPLAEAATISRLTGDWQAAPTLVHGEKLPPLDPHAVPGYELFEEIGRGGMGVVYKAKHLKLNRDVALKMVLSGAHAGSTERARFRAEAEAVAQLQHPNVVQVYDVGEAAGLPYLSLEICASSLQQKLDGKPWAPERAASLIQILARAVQAAHTAGVIHRDLKPGNVLLTLDGTPKLTDFGLAKRVGDSGGPTATGAVLGTPSYMAPEQASGTIHAGERGPRIFGPPTDVYALGSILYELLTGQPPFHGSSPLETLIQVTRDEPTPPGKLVPKIPRDLQTICLKCLEKEPSRRYATAAELADELRRFLRSEPIVARPSTAIERGLKWSRRRPAAAALIAVSVAGLLTLGGLGLYFNRELREERDAAMAAKDEAAASLELAKSEALKARRNNYVLAMGQAQLAWQQSAMTRLRTLLQQQEPRPGEEDLRGFEWHYWKGLSGGAPQALITEGDRSQVQGIAYSPDGGRLAVARQSGKLDIWDTKKNTIERSLQLDKGPIMSVAYGPEGEWIAAGAAGHVTIIDSTSGEVKSKLPTEGTAIALAVRNSDGQLAVQHGDKIVLGRVDLWDTNKGTMIRSLSGQAGIVGPMAYSPDGRFLAVGGFTVRLWDVATGEGRSKLPRGQIGGFSRDGLRLAIVDRNSMNKGDDIRVLNPVTGQQLYRCTGHTELVDRTLFSPDGNYLASAGHDNTVRVWNAGNGQEERRFRGRSRWNTDLAFHPNSQLLAVGTLNGAVELWPLDYDPEKANLRSHATVAQSMALHADSGRVAGTSAFSARIDSLESGKSATQVKGNLRGSSTARFSPDGELLVAGFPNGRTRAWDTKTGDVVRDFREADVPVGPLAFSGDGRRLAAALGSIRARSNPEGAKRIVLTSGAELVQAAPRIDAHNRVVIWDAATGERKQLIQDERLEDVNALALSADGTRLLTGTGRLTFCLWDAETGQHLTTLSERGGERNRQSIVALTPDGKVAALAYSGQGSSGDPGIQLVDTKTGKALFSLEGHARGLRLLTFNADGTRLASASEDETIRVWDTATGQEVLSRLAPTEVVDLGFTRDGKKLIAVGQNGTTRVWRTGHTP